MSSPSSRELLGHYIHSQREASSLLHSLEAEHSALAGMLDNFLRECGMGKHCHISRAQRQQQPQTKRPRDTEMMLQVTLEELFLGCVKQVTVPRRRHDAYTGSSTSSQECLQVQVQPGLHEGTRITLPGHGQDGGHSDLTFVVRQLLHPSFRRLADDLFVRVDIPLVTALTGGPIRLKHLGGQLLQLPTGDAVISPSSELVVPNQGMPVFGDAAGRRGRLHVRFNVCFPQHLSQQQQQQLRSALSGDAQAMMAVQQPCRGSHMVLACEEQQPAVEVMEVMEEDSQPPSAHEQHQQQAKAGAAVKDGGQQGRCSAACTAAAGGKSCCVHFAAAVSTAGSGASSSIAGIASTHSTSSSRLSSGYSFAVPAMLPVRPPRQPQAQPQRFGSADSSCFTTTHGNCAAFS